MKVLILNLHLNSVSYQRSINRYINMLNIVFKFAELFTSQTKYLKMWLYKTSKVPLLCCP